MHLIAVTGYKGSGKGEVAKALRDYFGYDTVKFAQFLKDMLRAFYRSIGVDDATIERKIDGDLKERECEHLCGRSPRAAMQTLGTEWGRELIGQSLWTTAFVSVVLKRWGEGRNVVCDDLRFPNEESTIRSLGGGIIRVDRPGLSVDTSHPSEKYIGSIKTDYVIRNVGTIKDLRRKVLYVADTFPSARAA